MSTYERYNYLSELTDTLTEDDVHTGKYDSEIDERNAIVRQFPRREKPRPNPHFATKEEAEEFLAKFVGDEVLIGDDLLMKECPRGTVEESYDSSESSYRPGVGYYSVGGSGASYWWIRWGNSRYEKRRK